MWRPDRSVLVLLAATSLVLVACTGDDGGAPTATDVSRAPAPDDDTGAATEDADGADGDAAAVEDTPADDDAVGGEDRDVPSGILLQLRGQQLTASIDDSQSWSCATAGDGGFASVMFLDGEGNDVSINYDEFGGTSVTLTLADGTNWNLAEDGVLDATRDADGTYRMRLQVTETGSGETEAADVRLSC